VKGDAFAPVPNRGLITISIMLANIMQGVDNTILNVALPHIQGSLSASLDQIAWALTSYGAFPPKRAAHQTMPCARDRKFADSPLEGGVRCELVSKGSFHRRSDEFLENIKRGPDSGSINIYTVLMFLPGDEFLKTARLVY
jgi:hypothetical protein